MPALIEYLSEEGPRLGLLAAEGARVVTLSEPGGRTSHVPLDRVLFRHQAPSVAELEALLERLAAEVDVPLLWDAVRTEPRALPRDPAELARLYFDDASLPCASAIFRALSREHRHFRRRGLGFEPRSLEEIAALDARSLAEARSREVAEGLDAALRTRPLDPAVAARIEQHLRGAPDRQLARALLALSATPEEAAFDLLLESGHLPWTASLEALRADLRASHPEESLAHAEMLEPRRARLPELRAAFTIDDPETREVDDALSVERDGELKRIEIDIADAAAWVEPEDPVDRDARRRAATAYLPTGRLTMLPERIGCELASLRAGEPRPALRTTLVVDASGELVRRELSAITVRVAERLDYEAADRLIAEGEGPTAEALRALQRVAASLAARRRAQGALTLRRREWKIQVSADGSQIHARPIPRDSASRALVAELMIAANGAGAEECARRGLPCIYRVQRPPLEPIDPGLDLDDPRAQVLLRRALQPVTLSTQRGPHAGLGLALYAQLSSPLRRYGDLVLQRQLRAAVAGEAAPYSTAGLLAIIATIEDAERAIRRAEAAERSRWSLELVARLAPGTALEGEVLGPAPGGVRVQLELCGAIGLLDGHRREPGERVEVEVKSVEPRRGTLRLRELGPAQPAR